ncbi:MAG: hypothetical protein LBD06_09420 [Candidatus Accumulibacter sp.]|nr:hypothetical protein [Accumulibacter sp.]
MATAISEDRNPRKQKTDKHGRFAPNETEKPSARFLCLLKYLSSVF